MQAHENTAMPLTDTKNINGSLNLRFQVVPSFNAIRWGHCLAVFSVMLVLRIIYAFHFRFDTDEPQHLHVVWGWANGHMQYRDIFDNHGPVFHLLCVPLFRAIGVRPDMLIPMRLAMIPLFGICLWCIYRIGSALFSRQVGLWSAIVTGFYPEFFLTSTEFRTDDLWTALWLLALVVATRNPFKASHAFIMGLLLGTAFGVTVKTGLMTGSLILAAAVITGWQWLGGKKIDWRFICTGMTAGLSGFALVPCALTLFFVAQGAGERFLYCNITHNLVPHAQNWQHLDAHVLWFPIFAALVAGGFLSIKHQKLDEITARRTCLVLTAGFYFTALKSFFPTLSRQDDLPVIPLAFLILASLVFLLSGYFVARPRLRLFLVDWLFPALVTVEVVALIATVPFWKNNTQGEIAMVADVLRVTEAGDFVMDATGETIFRMRPYYYALEAFTKVRIERGLIEDDIAERLIATQTAVVRPQDLTKKSRAFVRDNYLKTGNGLCMLGKELKTPSASAERQVVFDVNVPARYTVLTTGGKEALGDLDGLPVNGPRYLESGQHTFIGNGGATGHLAIFWAAGVENGFIPLIAK